MTRLPTTRGFTLIELMIVCAILGIVLTTMVQPIWIIQERWAQGDAELATQRAATSAYAVLDRLFTSARGVEYRSDSELRIAGPHPTTLRRGANGGLVIERTHGTVRIAGVPGAIWFGPFTAIDARTVSIATQLGSAKFPMVWRCNAP